MNVTTPWIAALIAGLTTWSEHCGGRASAKRTRRLIAIAHPKLRDDLTRVAKTSRVPLAVALWSVPVPHARRNGNGAPATTTIG